MGRSGSNRERWGQIINWFTVPHRLLAETPSCAVWAMVTGNLGPHACDTPKRLPRSCIATPSSRPMMPALHDRPGGFNKPAGHHHLRAAHGRRLTAGLKTGHIVLLLSTMLMNCAVGDFEDSKALARQHAATHCYCWTRRKRERHGGRARTVPEG